MMTLTQGPGDLVVATVDGIDVRFAGIALVEPSGSSTAGPMNLVLCLYLNGVRGQETALLDAQFRQKQQALAKRLRSGQQGEAHFPWWPIERIYERITISISDDAGTQYQGQAAQVGGEGTEWEMVWKYATVPPSHARSLRLGFSVDGTPTGKTCEMTLVEQHAPTP